MVVMAWALPGSACRSRTSSVRPSCEGPRVTECTCVNTMASEVGACTEVEPASSSGTSIMAWLPYPRGNARSMDARACAASELGGVVPGANVAATVPIASRPSTTTPPIATSTGRGPVRASCEVEAAAFREVAATAGSPDQGERRRDRKEEHQADYEHTDHDREPESSGRRIGREQQGEARADEHGDPGEESGSRRGHREPGGLACVLRIRELLPVADREGAGESRSQRRK